jgi:transcriptional activator of cad operon
LLDQAWPGVIVSPDSVYQAVTSLRRALGDDPKQPTYIETVPRLGYRMVATVGPWADQSIAAADASRRTTLTWAAGAAVVLALVATFLYYGKVANNPSIAVLPFLDLTEGMKEEEFADGMTVELIDKLTKIPGLRVHAPTPSSRLKGKRTTITDMAKMLDVAYVLDGSVRKSGARLRVVARLIRGNDESVVWSETYDRPFGDILIVQDDIAGAVTKALRASIEARPVSSPRASANDDRSDHSRVNRAVVGKRPGGLEHSRELSAWCDFS